MPIVGDPVYGNASRARLPVAFHRPALHAAELGFSHPRSGKWLEFRVELPDDLVRLAESLRGSSTHESSS
jgi:23S rRNA pseudouridine1911/1915/1917 synthase